MALTGALLLAQEEPFFMSWTFIGIMAVLLVGFILLGIALFVMTLVFLTKRRDRD